MDKFQNKYRILSARASWWDYSANGFYFITICTQNMQHWFGRIVETQNFASLQQEMQLSEIGNIAQQCWQEIPQHFPFVKLDAFVVMPNHVHSIIVINKTDDETSQPGPPSNRFGPQSKNLASIIRGYKTGVTKNARSIHPGFAWQPRFYDHIIRNDAEYKRIAGYINNNPANWAKDKFYKS